MAKNKRSNRLASALRGCNSQPGLEVQEECRASGVGNVNHNKMKMKT